MHIAIHHRCPDYTSYRAARVKSLFNVVKGDHFDLDVTLPLEEEPWQLGVVVGPSGSGKSSIGAVIFGEHQATVYQNPEWPDDAPIIEAIGPGASFDSATAALAAVGLGDVPAWLRPYDVLSNGERFRALLARVIADAPERVVIDEFTSVVDRQIARFGALAFAKAWRRTSGQCVLLTPHYDILDWVEPDWVFDTATKQFSRRRRRRPQFDLDIWETDWRYWALFEPHHYLAMPKMVAAKCYVGTVENEPVVHLAVSPRLDVQQFRAARLVVMPEWQGAGVGTRFLNAVCQMYLDGNNPYGKKYPVTFHSSHPGLAAALRRDPKWVQISATLISRPKRGPARMGGTRITPGVSRGVGFGGHFRAVQGFKFRGSTDERAGDAPQRAEHVLSLRA